ASGSNLSRSATRSYQTSDQTCAGAKCATERDAVWRRHGAAGITGRKIRPPGNRNRSHCEEELSSTSAFSRLLRNRAPLGAGLSPRLLPVDLLRENAWRLILRTHFR